MAFVVVLVFCARMQGTIHWVADCNAVDVTLNLYDNLFTVDEPLSDENKAEWLSFLNPKSLVVANVRTTRARACMHCVHLRMNR